MRSSAALLAILLASILSACGSQAPPPPPTPIPTSDFTPTAKPPVEIRVIDCGYGDFGFVTMAGTVTNNTDEPITFLQAVVALVKNSQVVRTDEIYIANATGQNTGILDGLDYQSIAGALAPGESLSWSVAYPFDKLTEPFECEASVTSAS
jgi:hypothetical protein